MKRFCCLCLLLVALASTAFAYGKTAADLYPQVVSADTIRALVEGHLERVIAESDIEGRHVLECVHIPRSVRAPDGALSFQVETPHGLRFWGNTSLEVTVLVDGVPHRKVICNYRVHLYDSIVVAARPLQANQPLAASDLRLEEREVGGNGQRYYTDVGEVVGKVLGRPAALGRALQRTMVKNPIIAQAGALVTIIANVSGVEVKMEGVTMQQGRVGELIKVRNTASKKLLRARVLDETTVAVKS